MKTIKNIFSYAMISIGAVILISNSLFGLAYTTQTNGEEMHQRSCNHTFQATGMLHVVFEGSDYTFGTATLIAPDVIITAAHLFTHPLRPNTKVATVSFQTGHVASDQPAHKAKKIWIHPNYNHETKDNDIAIVQLASPLHHIRPAELQKTLPSDLDSASATVIGYGFHGTKYQGQDYPQSQQVFDKKRRAGDIDISRDFMDSNKIASSKYTLNQDGTFIINPKDSKHRAFISDADSGGPVFIKVNGETYPRIIGINNASKLLMFLPSKGATFVDSFASVPYHYQWIESKLKLCGTFPYNQHNEQPVSMDYKKSTLGNVIDNSIENLFKSLYDLIGTSVKKENSVTEKLITNNDRNKPLNEESLKPVFDSWYNYLTSVEYPDLNSIASSMSEMGSKFFDEYIEAHKQIYSLYSSLWD